MNPNQQKPIYITRHNIYPEISSRMIILITLVCLLLFAGAREGLRQDELVKPIAEKILRFRILAHSDSAEDQQIKLQVRDGILNYLSTQVGDSAESDELEKFVKAHINDLEMLASGIISEHETLYPVRITLGECYFTEKTYGNLTFPRGN